MSKVNFSETLKSAEKEYGLNRGEYLKIQEGDNKIRLLSEALPNPSVYKGQKTFRFVCWVLDRKDGVIKPYFMPVTIMRAIESLQMDEEYRFEEVPMPYDINIRAKGAGTKEVAYSVIPAKNSVPLTEEEIRLFSEKTPIKEFQEKLKEQHPSEEPQEEKSLDEIPF